MEFNSTEEIVDFVSEGDTQAVTKYILLLTRTAKEAIEENDRLGKEVEANERYIQLLRNNIAFLRDRTEFLKRWVEELVQGCGEVEE